MIVRYLNHNVAAKFEDISQVFSRQLGQFFFNLSIYQACPSNPIVTCNI